MAENVKLETKEEGVITYRELRGNLRAALRSGQSFIVRSHSKSRAILIPLDPPLSVYYMNERQRETLAKAKALFREALQKLEKE